MLLKTSDKTHLFNLELVSKDDLRIEAVGSIDEANAYIGLAKTKIDDERLRKILHDVQVNMFRAGSQVVGGDEKITKADLEELLEIVRRMEGEVEFPRSFIILERDEVSAVLSVARSVVRRAERRVVSLYRNGLVDYTLVEWLNKLSYLLYLMILAVQKGEYEPVEL
ncbi:cob(I)yrinic acid a,c-diamide adenosyltransferase [Geoglobus ahangari]|uniref:cob(I)yrinic acid a,c-diamide adenosyltransferase n=1 Tax=Geoglobus ahangari TaxID=113653 RepID=UPI001FDF2FCA|nr:cob(I)yrinic acid a,c-diamide adenosyltransferase [Geoglobus ahangari]